ncbi:hypothetical protein ENSA5_35660 [Enhygromyxa salina]|uniref:Uncharacterized protein n=1 Tax=Enhygromyxa salina TaxID=215803 RepID=A0A2S9XVB4_9BACT|nr:hypothetical protein ENSA5_35660 [Enhygromyxa salina]
MIRDGPMQIIGHGRDLALSIDGWPRAFGLDGLHDPGLEPPLDAIERDHRVAGAYAVGPSGDLFLVVHAVNPTRGWYDAVVLRRSPAGWQELAVDSDPALIGYYSALFLRDGAVIGLLAYRPNEEPVDLSSRAADERVERARARAKTGFVRLAGSSDASIPVLPADRALDRVQATADGTVHALAVATTSPDGPPERVSEVLSWPPGASAPTRARLPEPVPDHLGLSARDADVLVFGDERYLVRNDGGAWAQIPVDLSPGEEPAGAGDRILAAVSSPAGELWLTLEDASRGPYVLLRRPVGGDWEVVHAPVPSEAAMTRRPFVYERGWVQATFEDDLEHPRYDALAWVDGDLWILASFGPLEHPFRGVYHGIRRNVLYASVDIELEPEVLTPRYADWSDGAAEDRRAPGDCDPFWIVLDATDDAGAIPNADAMELLAGLSDDPEVAQLELLYTGEIDGRRELVLQAHAEDRPAADQLVGRVGDALSIQAFAECRARTPIKAIEEFRR